MIDALFDSKNLENKLKLFSSGLGSFYASVMRDVGDRMAGEARNRAPNDSGKLRDSISFLMRGRTSALSTREQFGSDSVRYAWAVERGAFVRPKDGNEYMTFKINGQWVRLRSFRTKARPFMTPVFNSYWRGGNAKGYREMADALQRRMREELR